MQEVVSIYERAEGPFCLDYKEREIRLQGRHGKIVRRYPHGSEALAKAELKRLQARYTKREERVRDADHDLLAAAQIALMLMEGHEDFRVRRGHERAALERAIAKATKDTPND